MATTDKWMLPSSGPVPILSGAGDIYSNSYKNEFNVVDGYIVKVVKVVVHTFYVDSDDAILAAGQPLYEWQTSDAGKWIMEHAVEPPEWHRHTDHAQFREHFVVTARLKEKDYTFWALKWNNPA